MRFDSGRFGVGLGQLILPGHMRPNPLSIWPGAPQYFLPEESLWCPSRRQSGHEREKKERYKKQKGKRQKWRSKSVEKSWGILYPIFSLLSFLPLLEFWLERLFCRLPSRQLQHQ